MEKITVLIADDHALIRDAWKMLLNADPRFHVVADSNNGTDALEKARQSRPQVVLMDINIPGINGIDIIPLLRKYVPGTKIIGVSNHTQPAYAVKMMHKGAMGYVTKTSSLKELIKAITEVLEGRKYLCEEIRNAIAMQTLNVKNEKVGINSLTHRELEVIDLIKEGLSSKEIANQLKVSIKTIEVHRYNILRKLDLKNSSALVNYVNSFQAA